MLRVMVFAVAAALQTSRASAAGRKTVRIVEFNPVGVRTGVVEVEKIDRRLLQRKTQEHGRERAAPSTHIGFVTICVAIHPRRQRRLAKTHESPRPNLSEPILANNWREWAPSPAYIS